MFFVIELHDEFTGAPVCWHVQGNFRTQMALQLFDGSPVIGIVRFRLARSRQPSDTPGS